MNRRVLLLEPNYKNKFPPIALMKLATYFRLCGDDVVFYKGDLKVFVLRQITEECIAKLNELESSIIWRYRYESIFNYIYTRSRKELSKILEGVENPFIKGWVEQFQKFYHTGEYKKHPRWDWVGVTTLFTFYWEETIETIEFAKTMVKDLDNLMVGGVLASIQPKEIEEATGIKPHIGTLHSIGDIDEDNKYIIDELPLDYSILDEIDYVYPDNNAFFSYTTRGCIRHCPFCAVPILEPKYIEHIKLTDRIEQTRRLYGDQQNLLLMDNNVLASDKFPQIIEDIKNAGFKKGEKFIQSNLYQLTIRNLRSHVMNDRACIRKCYHLLEDLTKWKSLKEEELKAINKKREEYHLTHPETCTADNLINSYSFFAPYFEKRYAKLKGRMRIVDFNQGVDARLFTEERIQLLAQIPVKPLRIAFDNIKTKKKYIEAVLLSRKYNMKCFSNYLLYNFDDVPVDLYRRLKINVKLCDKYGIDIYSFPMKYHPIRGEHSHDRDYIGKHWNRKYIRAVQAILNATKGKIGKGKSFFEKAFGKTEEEYMELLIMPETFLIFRLFFEHIGYTDAWRNDFKSLTDEEREEIMPIIYKNEFSDLEALSPNPKIQKVLSYYKNYRAEIANPKSELFKQKIEFEKSLKIKNA
jgi:hypothetical protein